MDTARLNGDADHTEARAAWQRRCTNIAREMLKRDEEYAKPSLTADDMLVPLMRDLRLAVDQLPEYGVPGFLSSREVEHSLEVIATAEIELLLRAGRAAKFHASDL